jgi:hypothetical protein
LAVNILKEKLMKRVFNVALTDSHLQRMVYQEFRIPIHKLGVIVPKDITATAALPFLICFVIIEWTPTKIYDDHYKQ